MSNIFEELTQRGYTEQLTHPEEIKNLLDNESISFYIGFDPTADSLHVGHFISLMVASHMQKAGHRPIILIGGGTATIGDPSGKTDMRRMMSREEIDHNVECFKKQIAKFLSFEGENAAIIVNNADWLLDLKFINFAREIGSLFSINKMLAAECYKQRMERGLTFFELSYMLMQSYDFLYLHDKYGCKLQMGGNDQWSNILGGVDLIRRIGHSDSYGLTFKLLTTKEGKKMGKTEKGALWLDATKTSPYDFYQYWRNIDDADVKTVLSLLTFLPMEKVEELSNLKDEKINEAKKVAAYEITKLIHGEEEAKKAQDSSRTLFSGGGNAENMPTAVLKESDLRDGSIDILGVLVATGLCASRSEARRNTEQGGVSVDGEKVQDIHTSYTPQDFAEGKVVKRGKKKFCKVTFES